jgi:hypothetical protein
MRSSENGEFPEHMVIQFGLQFGQAAGDQKAIHHAMIGNDGDEAAAVGVERPIGEASGAERWVQAIASPHACERREAEGPEPCRPFR